MHYVSVENLGKTFGVKPLFSNISFHIEEGDKIALVAKNGAGKSTLLKILAGTETAEEGKIWINKDVTIALFEQEPVFEEEKSVLDNIFHHNHPVINAIKEFEASEESGDAERITNALVEMDELNAWDFDSKVKQILAKLNVHQLTQKAGSLSGGERKRVALAKTLIDIGFEHKHVLLIMDEPTNHLDVEMVEWLEHYLGQEKVTLLMVTHDRYFLDSVTRDIWELDSNYIYTYHGDYENFMEKKAARAESEAATIDKAKNLYRKELEWMRKQPKARTVKSKSRIDSFYEVEAVAKQKLDTQKIELNAKMSRLGGKVVEMKKVYKEFQDKKILQGFDYTFKKGDRVGVIGKNGVGKSTFLQLIQGLQMPDSGKINIGETVVFGHYAQQGLEIKEDKRIIEYVKDIAEHFPLANGATLSASQFLSLFLFTPDQQYTYISKLSGGEKRRLILLSILFRNPNFLILDEPTNDLDLPTLSVLENFLTEFQGCILLVSHDRYFMDRLVDHMFVFEGDGEVSDFPGNYTLYRLAAEEEKRMAAMKPVKPVTVSVPPPPAASAKPAGRKFSFNEQREFELLGKEIKELETEKEKVNLQLQDGGKPFEELQKMAERSAVITGLLEVKEMRWLELSEIAG
ncbi:MAG: ABC-F family ATP-binding cassette domain-containing protein [Chitinophagaceae bacterium]